MSSRYPDNIYLNVRIQHSDQQDTQLGPAKYVITKNQPIVNSPMNDYYMSVVEGILPLNSLPLFIARCVPDAAPNQSNVNKMECQVGLVGTDNVIRDGAIINCTYVPQNRSAPLPSPPVTDTVTGLIKQDFSSTYYYIYSIEHLLSIFNAALSTSNAFLNAIQPAAVGYPNDPYFVYDFDSQLIKLVFPSGQGIENYPQNTAAYPNGSRVDILQPNQAAPYSRIFINGATHEYLNGFNYYIDNNFDRYYFICNNPSITRPVNQWGIFDSNAQVYLSVSQEYYCLDTAFSPKRIIVTTDSINMPEEYTSIYDGKNLSSANTKYKIVVDLTPLSTKDNNMRQLKWVNEFGNNRLIDLISNEDLKRITLYFYFQDSFGNDHVLNISKYQNIFLKLAFQKKQLYLNV